MISRWSWATESLFSPSSVMRKWAPALLAPRISRGHFFFHPVYLGLLHAPSERGTTRLLRLVYGASILLCFRVLGLCFPSFSYSVHTLTCLTHLLMYSVLPVFGYVTFHIFLNIYHPLFRLFNIASAVSFFQWSLSSCFTRHRRRRLANLVSFIIFRSFLLAFYAVLVSCSVSLPCSCLFSGNR